MSQNPDILKNRRSFFSLTILIMKMLMPSALLWWNTPKAQHHHCCVYPYEHRLHSVPALPGRHQSSESEMDGTQIQHG